MPADHLEEIKVGLDHGLYTLSTKFFAIDCDRETVKKMNEVANEMGIVLYPRCNQLDKYPLSKILKGEYADVFYFDTCGTLKSSLISWIIREFLRNPSPPVDSLATFAFTFSLCYRGGKSPLIKKLADAMDVSVPLPVSYLKSSSVVTVPDAEEIIRALYRLMPGTIMDVRSFMYQSSGTPMVTVAFRVVYDSYAAASNLAHVREVLGNLDRLDKVKNVKVENRMKSGSIVDPDYLAPDRFIKATFNHPALLDAINVSGSSTGEIAAKSGVNRTYICELLKPNRRTSLASIKKVARALDVPWETLVSELRKWRSDEPISLEELAEAREMKS
jgi:hypothetical protein